MATVDKVQTVETKVFEWLSELGADTDAIQRDATLEDIDIDSLDLVEVAQLVQEEWQIKLAAEDVKDVKTVGDAVDLIASRMQ